MNLVSTIDIYDAGDKYIAVSHNSATQITSYNFRGSGLSKVDAVEDWLKGIRNRGAFNISGRGRRPNWYIAVRDWVRRKVGRRKSKARPPGLPAGLAGGSRLF